MCKFLNKKQRYNVPAIEVGVLSDYPPSYFGSWLCFYDYLCEVFDWDKDFSKDDLIVLDDPDSDGSAVFRVKYVPAKIKEAAHNEFVNSRQFTRSDIASLYDCLRHFVEYLGEDQKKTFKEVFSFLTYAAKADKV